MAEIFVRPTKEVEVDGITYKLTAFPAMEGLGFQFRLSNPGPQLIQEMIMKGVSKDSVAIDAVKFNHLFTGKLGHLMNLYQEVVVFNFTDPLAESDSQPE